MMTPDQFRAEMDAYLDRSGMRPTRFGRDAVGDPNFVFQVREGRVPSLRLAERALKFMREHESGSTASPSEVAA